MTDKTAEFMLEEYKQIANGYQDLHAQQNELIKFYLTLVAVPASVLAVVSQFVTKFSDQTSAQAITPASTPVVTQLVTQTTTQTNLTSIPAITPTALQSTTSVVIRTVSPDNIAAFAMPILLVLLIALTLIGFAVVLALITTRAEALLYVKTVNGVRRYFVEHDPEGLSG